MPTRAELTLEYLKKVAEVAMWRGLGKAPLVAGKAVSMDEFKGIELAAAKATLDVRLAEKDVEDEQVTKKGKHMSNPAYYSYPASMPLAEATFLIGELRAASITDMGSTVQCAWVLAGYAA